MTLQIESQTEEGKKTIETIKWVQTQINDVLERVIEEGVVTRGFGISFIFPEGTEEGEQIKVGILSDEPKTREEMDKLVKVISEKKFGKKIITPTAGKIVLPK